MAKKGTKKEAKGRKVEAKEGKKTASKRVSPKRNVPKDEYGLQKGSMSSSFAALLAEKPMSLKDAAKATKEKHPDCKLSFGKLVKQMVARGVAEIGKEGLIHVKSVSS